MLNILFKTSYSADTAVEIFEGDMAALQVSGLSHNEIHLSVFAANNSGLAAEPCPNIGRPIQRSQGGCSARKAGLKKGERKR